MAEKEVPGIVFGLIRVADGRVASMCTGRISVVPALVAAVRALSLDSADHSLDGEYHSNVLRLASARSWPCVDRSGLDHVAEIRERARRCDCRVPPGRPTEGATLNRLAAFYERGLRTLRQEALRPHR